MDKGRLEAFSDGVLAIILTIMVLELKVPRLLDSQLNNVDALLPLVPMFLSYVLSFIYVGIYWNNHHHLLQATRSITGSILWANMHLLFWLSLIPFATGFVGMNHFAAMPTALYGVVLFMAAVAFWILQALLIASEGPDSPLAIAVGSKWKERLSLAAYATAIAIALWSPIASSAIYVLVAMAWLIPDRRIESVLMPR